MKRIFLLLGIPLLSGLLVSGCGGNNSDDFVDTAFIYPRAVHAMVDSPVQTFSIGPSRFVSDIGYGNVSAFSAFASFDTSVDIRGRLADLSRFEIDTIEGLTFQTGFEYTFITAGFVDAPETFMISKQRIRRPFTEIYIQFAHAATLQDDLEIYLTAPGEDLANATPYATLGRTEYTSSEPIPEGEYQIRVFRASDGEQIYDSDVLQFFRDPNAPEDRGGRDWFFCLLDTVDTIMWPVKGLLTDGLNSFSVAGAGAVSSLRARNVAAGLGTVDVLLDGDASDPLASGLSYLESSDHRALVPDAYLATATPAGQPSDVLLESTVLTSSGAEEAFYLIDSETQPFGLLQLEDRRSVITEGRLGIVLAAPENQVVSIYVAYPEDVDVEQGEYGGLLANRISPPFVFSRLSRLPGDTLVTVTLWFNVDDDDGSNDEEQRILGPLEINLAAGDVRSLVLVPPAPGSSETLQGIVLDDL
jgi:hypothetical protein